MGSSNQGRAHKARQAAAQAVEAHRLHPSLALPKGASAAVIKVKERRVSDSGRDPAETVTTELQLADKLRALELLGRHLGMFKDGPPVVQLSLGET